MTYQQALHSRGSGFSMLAGARRPMFRLFWNRQKTIDWQYRHKA